MNPCSSCQKSKAPLHCDLCAVALCKSCAHFLEEGTFAFVKNVSPELQHSTYCPSCYNEKVAPALVAHLELVEKAKNVDVFYKAQGKESRFIRRSEKPLQVVDCADRDEVVLRLAYLAAQAGFNVLVDVDVIAVKVRNGGWQTSVWSGSAIPGKVDPAQLRRKFISAPN